MASRRKYVTAAEVATYSNGAYVDADVTDESLSRAEELIDGYVGYQDKFIAETIDGLAQSGSTTSLQLESFQVNANQQDYYAGCEVEIIGGTGAGQRSIVTGSTLLGVLTISPAFTTAPDATSYYRIYQLGKFPREQDVTFDGRHTPPRYYKWVPEAVKRATAAQWEYIKKMGDDYFRTDQINFQSESIGNYSYAKKQGQTAPLIAPKAKEYLRGIMNRKGTMIVTDAGGI
jgi:hypothetical protein